MEDIDNICRLLRYYILASTSKAGSGHVTSALSAVELMAVLFYKHFRFDLDDPKFVGNDRLIFSKGHASPLFYALYACAGKISEKEILNLRSFDSVLEGHPTKRFKYTEVPTGSLGQGLSAGVGMALSAKMDNLDFVTHVLLGDGEIAEGQVWEALNIASYYKLNNLLGIIDVNRLGQSGATITANDLRKIEDRVKAFGWRTYLISNGHNPEEIDTAFRFVLSELPKGDSPFMIIAKTTKGKGVSFLEDKEGWHGRALDAGQLKYALKELGKVDKTLRMKPKKPQLITNVQNPVLKKETKHDITNYRIDDLIATREAYGNALVQLGEMHRDVVSLDGDVNNSTFASLFKGKHPDRFFEMFIAEQNMVSCALGMSERGKVPFVSTFAAFFTRAFDQIRMASLSGNHMILCGSHAGVSVGQDGPSQMGLEDMAFFRSQFAVVFYPSDAVSSHKLTKLAYEKEGLVYIRTTRPKIAVLYKNTETFALGGSKVLKESDNDKIMVIACGITVHETLKAYEDLKKEGISIRVIDAYCIKPIDKAVIIKASKETKAIITVEDHYISGGLGDAVLEVLAEKKVVPVYKLAVTKIPKSGDPEELLGYEGISAKCIADKVRQIVKNEK